MIILLTTASHTYTHDYVADQMPAVRQVSYPVFFGRRHLPKATYIFTDFDRLSFWQLELAAHVFRQIQAAGWCALNDPARVLHRLELLQRFKAEGLNSFSAWPASAASSVDAFPVFVRTQSAHRGNLTDLLHTPEALATAIESLINEGYPINDLMISEYCAEAQANGVFRKLSVYRVGARMIATPSVYESHWSAKYGELGAAGEAGYREDLNDIITGRYCDELESYFALAGVDYGRADFSVVNDQIEVYEINTNPHIEPSTQHPFSDRLRAFEHADEAYLQALHEIDTDGGGAKLKVELPKLLSERRRRVKLWPGYQWMP